MMGHKVHSFEPEPVVVIVIGIVLDVDERYCMEYEFEKLDAIFCGSS